jgi:lipopolysaccharide export LptBFGC system permease protein LptF
MTRPGFCLLALARRVVDPRTMTRLIEPTVADLQHEYLEAARQRSPWPRRRALARGYASVARLAGPLAWSCIRRFSTGFVTEDDHVIGRLVAFTLAAVAILTGMLVAPPLLENHQQWLTSRMFLRVAPLLLPQALGLALPLGLLAGTLMALRGRTGVRSRISLVRLAAIALSVGLLTLVATAWLVPAGNQRFRQVIANTLAERDGRARPVALMPGPNEMPLAELDRQIDALRNVPGSETELNRMRFSYHVRLALAVSPLALLLLAMGVSSLAGGRWWAIVATVVGNPLAVMVIWGDTPFDSTPVLQAWMPVIAIGAVGSLMLIRGRRRRESGHATVLRGS